MSVSIEDLKDEVTITEVLAHFGGSVPTGRYYGGEWRPMVCPFCADRNGSASVNLSAGRFVCHQCGAPRDGRSGDIFDVAMFGEGFASLKDAMAWIERTFR